jgi:hypothetical protein
LNIYIYVYMKDTKVKLTSVKVIQSLYNDFRVKTVNSSMNLQKLVNRSIHKYINDATIREDIETYDKLYISGSRF